MRVSEGKKAPTPGADAFDNPSADQGDVLILNNQDKTRTKYGQFFIKNVLSVVSL